MDCQDYQPLVSCIMPTYNRRQFLPHAIRYFLKQDYQHKELLIIDDGTDAVKDLVPDMQAIRYFRINQKISLGAKLNMACEYSRGNIIAHWDDDDWYATRRLSYQVKALLQEKTRVCGINHLLYYDLRTKTGHQYIYPPEQRKWLLGSSLCYTRDLWNNSHFADIDVGMDGLFVWATAAENVTVLDDFTIAVHMIHATNVSEKKTDGGWWHSYPVEDLRKIISSEWAAYESHDLQPVAKYTYATAVSAASIPGQGKSLKNIYACLVHENEDCVIDLVRNLHYHDPSSSIILYDGSEHSRLIQSRFSYSKLEVVLHPKPAFVKHGYLHHFALACMEFASENFSFDTITFVDSDQLGIRSGYSAFISTILSSSNIGMFSSRPERITPDNTNEREVWPAIQAYREYSLWEPFLQNFAGGKEKFPHWTFWPSTVFTADAVQDLLKLFNNNKLLQDIMRQTKIWATEEVILPTLVKLLGYEIIANPCSYDFVKYQKIFATADIDSALHTTDAYWIHPIERRYETPHRKYIREYFSHYITEGRASTGNNHMSTGLLLTVPLLNSIKKIPGWLSDAEADLLIAITTKCCRSLPVPHNIVEIGSYHGRSTILFGTLAKMYLPQTMVYAIDTHDGRLGAEDQGLQSFPPSSEIFKRNIREAGLQEFVEMIEARSYDVNWQKNISVLFIDGLHDYLNVSRDFWHFSQWVRAGGYVAFHDYADYFPGVKALVHELLATGTYRYTEKIESLMVLQKL